MLTRRAFVFSAAVIPAGAATLAEQSAARVLERDFPDPALSYLLLDATGGRQICSRWTDAHQPIPVGSLVKPFTALAYRQTHAGFPRYTCKGCWLPEGHGLLDITGALAYSCNSYFLQLARWVDPAAITDIALKFGLTPPEPGPSPELLTGLGDAWRNSPVSVAQAYRELIVRAPELLPGLALSARAGTGKGIGPGAFAKTGTAPCLDGVHLGDGFAIALYPSESPRFALLVRRHGTTGSHAAIVCGKMRRAWGGKA